HSAGSAGTGDLDDVFVARIRPAGKGAADLIFATFLGGSSDDEDPAIAVDSKGFVYVAGETESEDFPMVDPIQGEAPSPGEPDDIFLSVFDPTGSELLFSTYLGGGAEDDRADIFLVEQPEQTLDTEGAKVGGRRQAIADNIAIYLVGDVQSADFPVTEGVVQPNFAGDVDFFITKIVNELQEPPPSLGKVTTVSAASFTAPVAEDSIASAFAAIPVEGATEVLVKIVDSAGMEWSQEPFFFHATQANLYIPPGIALGMAKISILVDGVAVAEGEVEIKDVAPGIFFFGTLAQPVAAAFALTIAPDGTRTQTDVFNADLSLRAINLGPDGTAVYLLMFGTGIRDGAVVTATVNGVSVPILGYAPHSVFQGLDQVNIGPLPRAL
ncbi:MAG: hypothetical protein GY953_44535, partial [bacterium]|nr:hypothetical protein [bacterium]